MSSLFIPVILGTAREGRHSECVALFVLEALKKREGIETQLVDVRDFRLPATDDTGESDTAKRLALITSRADGFIIVSPEYNHGYPGELKMMLDMSDGEYARKPVAVCGVSDGTVGGARMMEQLRLVLLDLKSVPILASAYFAKVKELFDDNGVIQDQSHERRLAVLFDELTWYASVLKGSREQK